MSHDWGKHGRKQQEGLPHRTPAHVRVTQVVLLPRIKSPSFFYLFFFFLPAMTAAAHAWEPVDSIHKFLWWQRLASICSWHHSPRASLCIAPSLLRSRREFKVLFGNWAEIKLSFFKGKGWKLWCREGSHHQCFSHVNFSVVFTQLVFHPTCSCSLLVCLALFLLHVSHAYIHASIVGMGLIRK